MKALTLTSFAFCLALASETASTSSAPHETTLADLAWLSGTWVQEGESGTVHETWLAPLGGAMAGVSRAVRPGEPPFIEFMTITQEDAGVTFTAIIQGQAPTPFVLLPGAKDTAVFENKDHDFPQRVIYRQCGADLCARIEGMLEGKVQGEDWRYRRLQ